MKTLHISKYFKISLFTITALLLSQTIQADNKALMRAQSMLRQLNSQKVQLESKNSALTVELDKLRKETKKQLKKQKHNNKKLSISTKKKAKYIEKLRKKLKQILLALRQSEQQRLQANNMGKLLDAEVKQCVNNNGKLVKMNDKLIDSYNKKSCWDSIKQNEPFTGISQVEIENILQEYRFNNEDNQVKQDAEYEQYGSVDSVAPNDMK